MSVEVKNSVALVTGANRGIGRAITEGLLEAGAKKVYAAVRTLQSADALVAQFGDRVVPVEFDLTRPDTAAAAAKVATDVDIVVSNAGIIDISDPLADGAIQSLQVQMEGNVYPLISLAQAFGPVLKANGGGAFAQMNSLSSLKTFTAFTTYSASKSAAYSVTQGLRDAWTDQGTQVISILAGPIKTDMADTAGLGEGAPPASTIADALIDALRTGEFLVYPDPMAQSAGEAYAPFADNVIHAATTE